MADNKERTGIKEYAEGWITERTGTEVPGFLKFAFVVIAAGCIAYFFIYMFGETTHADRGVLVERLNAATVSSTGLMYLVGALAIVFALVLAVFTFRRFHEDGKE